MKSTGTGAVAASAAERPLALAVDIGSSSVRAILHDRRGRRIDGCASRLRYRMHSTAGGGVFTGVEKLRDLVALTLDEVCALAGNELLSDVAAVGTACFSHSLVGLDREGRPLTPVLSWADTTSAESAETLRAELDEASVWKRTGAPLHASYWPARIRHHRRKDPSIARWSGFAELLGEWLTGRRAASISMASSSGLLARERDEWDAELLENLRIGPAALPLLLRDDQPLGALRGELAARWPALADVPWFPAWADGACGNVGLGCHGPDRAALMIGTSSAMRVLLDRRDVEPLPGLFCFRLGESGSLLGGQLSEGGGTAAWVSRLTGLPLSELEHRAADVAPLADGLLMLPYLSGERGPGYRARARATLDGLSLSSGPAHVFRAALESVALSLAGIDRLLTAAVGRQPAVVAAGGGVARSKLWPSILADALGRPVEVPAGAREPSARGAALLALSYVGITRAAHRPGLEAQQIEPDLDRHGLYAAALERRSALYERLRHGSR